LKKPIVLLLAAALCLCVLFQAPSSSAEPVPVFVSILPQKTFVEKIGGSLVSVSVMVLPGANPHNYEPKPGQMIALSKASVYFAIGIGFEDIWLKRFGSTNPRMKIVHTEQGIEKITMLSHDHQDSPQDEHDGIADPHVWLSPPNVKIIAKNIANGLSQADPARRADYEENLRKFETEIDSLDAELRKLFSDRKGAKFMVFHPAWGYFAHAYGLEQIPVEIEGKEPKPSKLKALIERAKRDGIRVVFVQPQFSTKSAEAIAKAIGGEVAVADDLHPDWANNLRSQAEKFKKALR